ncbi:MAG: DUF4919 domain-containing protein [Muribaculaceae bacterium]|nr:DUF4919 domain-containing protein [Muribaculaceae bacterium]
MKLRFFTILFLLPMALMLSARAVNILPELKREKPDMEQIKRETLDSRSQYYYPRLMEEFLRNDTLMKIDKYRRLYLGYVFQEDYTPYRSADHPLSYMPESKVSREDCDSIIAVANTALADNPFDLQQIMLMINALRIKGKTNLAAIWQYKLNYIIMAIISTGSGHDKENAWYVIEPQHEYVLLNMLGYYVDSHSYEEPYYEYFTVTDEKGRKKGGYYFNIKNMLEEYYRKHPEEIY